MSFTPTMLNTVGRYVLTAVGAVIATLGAVGLMSQTDAATATTALKSLADSVGQLTLSITTLAGIAAGLYAASRGTANDLPANQAAIAAALKNNPDSPVKGIIVESTLAGRALATEILNANPAAGVAPAGTAAAATIAKPSEPPPIKTGGKPA